MPTLHSWHDITKKKVNRLVKNVLNEPNSSIKGNFITCNRNAASSWNSSIVGIKETLSSRPLSSNLCTTSRILGPSFLAPKNWNVISALAILVCVELRIFFLLVRAIFSYGIAWKEGKNIIYFIFIYHCCYGWKWYV